MSAASPTSPAAAAAASPDHSDGGSPSSDPNLSMTPQSQSQTSPQQHDDGSSLPYAPSTADGEKHPKGRRKRTTAEDKRILEEAFRNDAKPDKAARRDIVNRVSLNEREVQIWFQNRRQNDRRKSRPLTAQDIEHLRSGGLLMPSSDPITSQDTSVFEKTSPASHLGHQTASFVSSSPAQTSPELPRIDAHRASAPPMPLSYDTDAQSAHDSTPLHQEPPSSQESRGSSQAFAQSQSSTVGYLANRRNLANSWSGPSPQANSADGPFKLDPSPASSFSNDHRPLSLSKSQSNMRLSLSLEGKAEVVSNQQSPVRQPLTRVTSLIHLSEARPASLRRSLSDAANITLPPISSWPVPPPRLGRGRSRHVQAWESCADADTRDELTAQAEHESSGSAIAEISLLRSTNSVLQPISSKRNASLTRPAQSRQAKKTKFSRVYSSAARLETDVADEAEKRKDVKSKMDFAVLLSPTDSDKENWSPGADGSARDSHERRPLPSGPSKPQASRRHGNVLGERRTAPSLGRAKTAPTKHRPWETKGAVDIFEDSERSKDGAVEKFMTAEVSPSKKGDVDCAVGLLSLSKGAWR